MNHPLHQLHLQDLVLLLVAKAETLLLVEEVRAQPLTQEVMVIIALHLIVVEKVLPLNELIQIKINQNLVVMIQVVMILVVKIQVVMNLVRKSQARQNLVMKNLVRKNLLVQKKQMEKIQSPQELQAIGTKKIKNQGIKLLIKQEELPSQKFQIRKSLQT